MKNIILFGDSIRLGYQNFIKQSFEGVATVSFPSSNGAFMQNMLRYLNIWKVEENLPENADVVHWNAGAWDVLRIMGDDTLTSPEYYGELIVRVHKRITELFPNAVQIFATTTNGVEELYSPPYQRYNSDIIKFNKIALEKLLPLGVKINDLYELTKDLPANSPCRSDLTHFSTEEGIKLLGGQVVKSICTELKLNPVDLKYVDAIVKNFSKQLIRE